MGRKKKPPNKCCVCGVEIGNRSKRCRKCAPVFDMERRQKQSVGVKAAWADPEKGSRMRAAARTTETRHKRSKSSRKRWNNPAEREKVSKIHTQLWANPKYRSKMLDIRTDTKFRVSAAKKQSALWKDEEYRNKQIAVRCTPEARQLASSRLLKRWEDGIIGTPAQRQGLSVSMKAAHARGDYKHLYNNPKWLKKVTASTKAAWKRGVYDGVFQNPSKLERDMAIALENCGILYIPQYRLKDNGWPYDFFIPAGILLVEVDGDYWHSLPGRAERDAQKDELAKERGFELLRITETELKESGALSIVMERILPICTCICGGVYGSSSR
jgi:hypothetical protein